MKNTKTILLIVSSIVLLAAGCNTQTATTTPEASTQDSTAATTGASAQHTGYADYSAATLQSEQAAGHKVVLFFHATWCPFCKEADKQFKAHHDQIPTGVTVLKTDYDTEKELKKKYNIKFQHTFVQIDTNGNEVSKWTGGDIANLKKYLK